MHSWCRIIYYRQYLADDLSIRGWKGVTGVMCKCECMFFGDRFRLGRARATRWRVEWWQNQYVSYASLGWSLLLTEEVKGKQMSTADRQTDEKGVRDRLIAKHWGPLMSARWTSLKLNFSAQVSWTLGEVIRDDREWPVSGDDNDCWLNISKEKVWSTHIRFTERIYSVLFPVLLVAVGQVVTWRSRYDSKQTFFLIEIGK